MNRFARLGIVAALLFAVAGGLLPASAQAQIVFRGSSSAVGPAGGAIAFRAATSAVGGNITFRAATNALGANITFRAAATGLSAVGVLTLTVARPAFAVDDVMVAAIGVAANSPVITAPVGWTLVRQINNAGPTANSLAVYYRVATASEPPNYTWTLSASTGGAVGGIQSFFNVDTANPIDVENGQTTPVGATHLTPSVTTTVANAMVVTSHTYASSQNWTPQACVPPPVGCLIQTESFDQRSAGAVAVGQSVTGGRVVQPAAGATGRKSALAAGGVGSADAGNTHILALRPGVGNAITITTPAGTLVNDVMVAAIGFRPNTLAIATPAGWTFVRRMNNPNGNANSLAVYIKVAGAAEPATHTWVFDAVTTGAAGGIQSFSGVDTTTPINVENGQCTPPPGCAATTLAHATPSVTTTVANTMIVTAHTFSSSATWTPPAGMTESYDRASLATPNANGQSIEGNRVGQGPIGATGIKIATASANADVGNAHILALRPAPAVVVPGSFNAFETSTAAGAVNGRIYTKLAGTGFSLAVVAISAGAQQNTFNDNVKVELLGNTTTGLPLDAQNCPPALPTTVVQTIASAPIVSGRSNVNFAAVSDAWKDVRVRISWPTVASTVIWCSTDNFAIRPVAFSSVTSNMTNVGSSGAPVARAGDAFTITAVAGTGYDGTPLIDAALVTAHVGAVQVGAIGGAFSPAAIGSGTATGNSFTYSEVGNFTLGVNAVFDSGFTTVDSAAGDCTNDFSNALVGGQYGCLFGNSVAAGPFGRFTPDHFDVALNAPVFATACTGFTYVGQGFNYAIASAPVVTVTARNSAALGNATTRNYTGTWWKISNVTYPGGTARGYAAFAGALDITGLPATDPVVVDTGGASSGTGTLTFGSGSGLLFTRTAPVAPFNADIGLSINVIDADGIAYTTNPAAFGAATAGNGITFGAGKEMRFGRLRLTNANGSELLPLSMRMSTQYFTTGAGFVDNVADNCTTITAPVPNNVGLGNYQLNLGAGDTVASIAAGAFVNGVKTLTLSAPLAGNNGAVDVVVNLEPTTTINTCLAWLPGPPTPTGANLAHLRDLQYCSAGLYDRDPTARATFGVYGVNPNYIFQRENY